jgi:hypothetical protein
VVVNIQVLSALSKFIEKLVFFDNFTKFPSVNFNNFNNIYSMTLEENKLDGP